MRAFFARAKTKKCGFTVVEAMVAVAILATIGAIAAPSLLNSLPNMRLRRASRDIHSMMMQAKTEAIRRSINVTLLFNSPGGTYTMFIDNGAGGGIANDEVRNGSELVLVAVTPLPDRVTFDPAVGAGDGITFPQNALVFSLRGIPTPAGAGFANGTVALRSIDSLGNTLRQRTIAVSTAGRISMQ